MQLWMCCFADSISIHGDKTMIRQYNGTGHLHVQCSLLKPNTVKRTLNLDHQLGVSLENVLTGL